MILDPNRAKRPNVGHKAEKICPFCIGFEKNEEELYRVGGKPYDFNWHLRVVTNKFPFAPIHEIIIHSPDHHKNFEELPLAHVELILKTYRERYNHNKKSGQVYIFHNRGIGAGESLPHPHTQLTVIPNDIPMEIPVLDLGIYGNRKGIQNSKFKSPSFAEASAGKQKYISKIKNIQNGLFNKFFRKNSVDENISKFDFIETKGSLIFCPEVSQWPDEIWIAPVKGDICFGDIDDHEISDLAFCLQRIISIFDLRHGHEFPFNFYIYPGKNWYLRIIPRNKVLGGFEVGTGIIVNTQDPKGTFAFVRDHFFEPDLYKIRMAEREEYWESV